MIGAILSGGDSAQAESLFYKRLETINDIEIGLSKISNDIAVYAKEYPRSVTGLIRTFSICDYAIYIPPPKIGAIDAEIALAVEFSNVKDGLTLVDGQIDTERMDTLFNALKISKFQKASSLTLKDMKIKGRPNAAASADYVSVDKYFLVKGIGTVFIGFVLEGEIRKSQRYYLLPSGKQVSVKSIQVMDEDRANAKKGDYVGVALNNADEEDLADNYGLSDSCQVSDKFTGSLDMCKFYNRSIEGIDIASAFNGKEINLKMSKDNGRDVYTSSERMPLTGSLLLMDSSIGKGKNRVIGRLNDLKPV